LTAPTKVLELVERFDRNLEAYKQGHYKEAQVRQEFIDPFFKALGWDIGTATSTSRTIPRSGPRAAPRACTRRRPATGN